MITPTDRRQIRPFLFAPAVPNAADLAAASRHPAPMAGDDLKPGMNHEARLVAPGIDLTISAATIP